MYGIASSFCPATEKPVIPLDYEQHESQEDPSPFSWNHNTTTNHDAQELSKGNVGRPETSTSLSAAHASHSGIPMAMKCSPPYLMWET